MSTDKRCGTCRHYTPGDGYSYNGHCAVGAFLGRATAFSGETGCPGWSPDTPTKAYYSAVDMLLILAPLPREVIDKAMKAYHANYARGWRDAIAAAGALCHEKAQATEAKIHSDTDIHLGIELSAIRDVSAELGYDISALTPPA